MRLSISAKVFVGFVVVLALSIGGSTYSALTVRQLGDDLRLVTRSYLELRLQVAEMQTVQGNLLRVMDTQLSKSDGREGPSQRLPRYVKIGIDEARRARVERELPRALQLLGAIEAKRSATDEEALLAQLRTRLERLGEHLRQNESLFEAVYGPLGSDGRGALEEPAEVRAATDQLLRSERTVARELVHLGAELRLRAEEAALRLEASENRAIWATMLLALGSALVGVLVLAVVTAAVRPLRRLAERAKEIARGDYRQRVDSSSSDEVGALGREFNAMAAALEEREQRLIRSERLAAVGRIAAQITHEVRNPLSSIGLNAELLEETLGTLEGKPRDREEAVALTRAIVKEVDRLTEVTEAYLGFARLPRPQLEREELRTLVGSLLDFLRAELEQRGVAVEVDLEEGLPPIAADAAQLRQALLNLVRNAVEAMGGRRAGAAQLRLAARALEGGEVELLIQDSGEGIPEEHRARLFEPFFSTKERGTGLGLALTRQIIGEHGGEITVESTSGVGTTFRLSLQRWSESLSGDPLAPSAPRDS